MQFVIAEKDTAIAENKAAIKAKDAMIAYSVYVLLIPAPLQSTQSHIPQCYEEL